MSTSPMNFTIRNILMNETLITSTSEDNKSFTTYLDLVVNSDRCNNADEEWIHFLQDHYFYLWKNSHVAYLSESVMNRYAYRVRDYLNDLQDGHRDIELAFRVINRLASDQDFTAKLEKVMIPDPQQVSDLYRAYRTLKAKIGKL